jgi:hypothetical protein
MTTNLFAACRTDGALSVKRVRVTRDVQRALAAMFAQQDEEFFKGVTDEVPFDGDWKPDANELLTLDAPDEAAVITDALQANVTSITELGGQPTEGVRALFTGVQRSGKMRVLLQAFTARQILSRKFALLLDGNLIAFNAEHLRRILARYATYYNEVRTHVSLCKDAPCTRLIERIGDVVAHPILGGLHHRYARI